MKASYMCQKITPSWGLTFILTLLGVAPLWVCALSPNFYFDESSVWSLIYACIVLSFLGGSNWTIGILRGTNWAYIYSIIPAIASWLIIIATIEQWLELQTLWLWMGLAYIIQLVVDIQIARDDEMPSWFAWIRALGTVLLLLATAIVAIRLGFAEQIQQQ